MNILFSIVSKFKQFWIKISFGKNLQEENLYNENYDPLAEMLKGGAAEPVDIQRVVKWLEKIAGSLNGWKEKSYSGQDLYRSYKVRYYQHFSGIQIHPSGLYVRDSSVKFKGEKIKFLQNSQACDILNTFWETLRKEQDRQYELEKLKQIAEIQKKVKIC